MDLSRAASRFATSPILNWDETLGEWIETQSVGALQVFDRFITEREFGQKKRVLLVPHDQPLPDYATIIRLEGSQKVFLVEKFNEDVAHGKVYSHIYQVHEAPYRVDIRKAEFEENAAGAPIRTGDVTVQSVWVDISRFASQPSRRAFDETEYTIVTVTFPRGAQVDTDSHLITDDGSRYNIDEIFDSLDLIQARGKRVGE